MKMNEELREFFARCLEQVEVGRDTMTENERFELAEDLEDVAEALRENDPEKILEY